MTVRHVLPYQPTQLSDLLQKCDAKCPCTGCTRAGSTSECVYDNRISRPHRTTGPQRAANSVQPSASTFTNSPTDGTFDDVLSPDLPPPTSDATPVATYELAALQTFEAVRTPRGHSLGLVPSRTNSPELHLSSDVKPSISIVSFLPPEIFPGPRMPLSFLGEMMLQVSADTIDIDMRS